MWNLISDLIALTRLHRVFWPHEIWVRKLSTSSNIVSKTNMVACYDRAIVIWKGAFKTVLHNIVFMWWNLGFPAIAPVTFIGLIFYAWKRGQPKRKHRGKRLPKGNRFKILNMLRYRSWWSAIPLCNIICNRESKDLLSKIYHISNYENFERHFREANWRKSKAKQLSLVSTSLHRTLA